MFATAQPSSLVSRTLVIAEVALAVARRTAVTPRSMLTELDLNLSLTRMRFGGVK